MIKLMEVVGYLFVIVCVGEFVGSIVVDRLRLNRMTRLTKEIKEIDNQIKNK